MIDLKQKELAAWQAYNFGIATPEQVTLGMAEEVGELCHAILKRSQNIREGHNSNCLHEIADAFGDVMIYGIQLMSIEGLDAEQVLRATIDHVLTRDWRKNPQNGKSV